MNLPSLFRTNDDIFSADPFMRMAQIQREMDRTFRDLQRDSAMPSNWAQTITSPSCDIQDAEGHFLVTMDIPGMKKEDIKVELSGNQLSIWGERNEEKEEKKKGNYRSERFYGSFARSFTLPDGVKAEDIATEYKDGVLRIAIPKNETAKPKQIKIGEHKPGFFERLLKKDQKSIDVKDANKVA